MRVATKPHLLFRRLIVHPAVRVRIRVGGLLEVVRDMLLHEHLAHRGGQARRVLRGGGGGTEVRGVDSRAPTVSSNFWQLFFILVMTATNTM